MAKPVRLHLLTRSFIKKTIKKIRALFRSARREVPKPQEIDREYIEGETPTQIGKIAGMTGEPDKDQRHLSPDERKAG